MKRDKLIIVLFSLVLGLIFIRFGSSMDFLNQHIVFPNYLRELFYSSGKIIPSFMIHIGSGQNVFNIAYYGLLSPIIMISYLFPFIRMLDYIIISNIILYVLSNLLFYKFVSNKFNNSLFLTLLFMLSGPILFQFHRHFMFVNYMPFLILALINIDNKKYSRLIIDMFLIIMTSFYYSIPSILCIIIYYIYINFDKFSIKKFLRFICYIFISILMASILLIPVIYSILSTRSGVNSFDISLLIPNINLDNILYGGYSVGLTSICFISFIYLLFSKKKNNIFLFIIMSLICFIPISLYLLNGGLYVRGKCLIPFLPLFIYIIGLFINDIDKINFKKFLLFVLFINLIVLIRYHVIIYYIDLVFILVLLFLYSKFKKKNIIYIPIVLMSFIICIIYNIGENYFSRSYYKLLNSDYNIDTKYRVGNLISVNDSVNINSGNMISSIYSSTINKYYSNLYHNVFRVNNSSINNMSLTSTSNPLFNRYMGIKYVYSDYDLGFPYKKVNDRLYLLDSLPIGYVNSRCVNREYFNGLEFPYNIDILMNYVPGDCSNKPVSSINEVSLDYSYELGNNSYISDGKLYVDSDDIIKVYINDDMSGKILFVSVLNQFEQEIDINMSINGQSNLLTHRGWLYPNNNNDFNFVVSGNELEIKVSKGIYNISNIRTYIMDYEFIDDYDIFNINVINSEKISGNISVRNSGYFILSIPYDKGFDIKVNGENISYNEINGLIGFYLDKGDYNINIDYESPGLKIGEILSGLGLILFIGVVFIERRVKSED
ncbi:MAG: YfhO family protein [Bacilli bacterium]